MTGEEAVQREARRVAAAFGVERLRWRLEFPGCADVPGDVIYHFFQFNDIGKCVCFSVGDGEVFGEECEVKMVKAFWHCTLSDAPFSDFMARGLYCLGFEDESILSQLPPLSMHEKLELRMSLPREFWPAAWEKDVVGR
jgi:hypothetical protein